MYLWVKLKFLWTSEIQPDIHALSYISILLLPNPKSQILEGLDEV